MILTVLDHRFFSLYLLGFIRGKAERHGACSKTKCFISWETGGGEWGRKSEDKKYLPGTCPNDLFSLASPPLKFLPPSHNAIRVWLHLCTCTLMNLGASLCSPFRSTVRFRWSLIMWNFGLDTSYPNCHWKWSLSMGRGLGKWKKMLFEQWAGYYCGHLCWLILFQLDIS